MLIASATKFEDDLILMQNRLSDVDENAEGVSNSSPGLRGRRATLGNQRKCIATLKGC